MKDLEKALKGIKTLVFLDLEGTQYSHEIIEIGAHKVTLKDDGTIKKIFKGFKQYVRPKERIGHYVTKLTGITEELIKKEGVPFRVAQQGLKKYVGKDYAHCRFVTFGTYDYTMILSSAENNMDASMEEARYVVHHGFDFSAFLSRYIKSEQGNPLSLANYLKLFEVEFHGKEHDALADAYNLALLYKAFLDRKDIVEAEYKKTLEHFSHLPSPIAKVMRSLNEGKSVSTEDYDRFIKESLQ